MPADDLIFDLSVAGRRGTAVPETDVPVTAAGKLPGVPLRTAPPLLPEVDELTVVRHFTRLSQKNFSIDTVFYPLGSCTMKYNPKLNERIAHMPGFAGTHPLQENSQVQGFLRVFHELQEMLARIGGMDAATLQPAAGAQGEMVGLLMIKAYHASRGDGDRRDKIIIPESAHGTNPASAARCGCRILSIGSRPGGGVDLDQLAAAIGDDTAAFMLTNPSTFGMFEREVETAARMVHDAGGLVYYDGANMNAIMGKARPGDMGCDVMHFNVHKTFSTPHGGGGPGAGPVAVKALLEPFLPVPVVVRDGDRFLWDSDRPRSIGKVHAFYGNAAILLRACAYIITNGGDGLTEITEKAVLNANYLLSLLDLAYQRPFGDRCKHEFVISCAELKRKYGVRALDVAKRLIDFGVHPPTMYFPLVVEECLMVEPTESETPETLEAFARVLNRIAAEAADEPSLLHEAPHAAPVTRLDEATAARHPDLRWRPDACSGAPAGTGA